MKMAESIQLGGTAMAVLAGVVIAIAIPGFFVKAFGVLLIIGGLVFASL